MARLTFSDTAARERRAKSAVDKAWEDFKTGKVSRAEYERRALAWGTIKHKLDSHPLNPMWENPSPHRAEPRRQAARPVKRAVKALGPYYVIKAGKRVYHKTLVAAAKFAQAVADKLDKPVAVRQAKRPTKTARARLR